MAKMMIVDSSSFLRNILKFILENDGHTVVGLPEGFQDTVVMYSKLKPDIVFCDISPSSDDGVQLVRAIREIHPGARVVTSSLKGLEARVDEARKAGACAHLEKPYTVVSVAKSVDLAFGKR